MSGHGVAVRWERRILRTPHAEAPCCLKGSCSMPYRPAYLAPVLVIGSYADHTDGTNAHPGHRLVARITGLTWNADRRECDTVRRAAAWAIAHGWLIEQTPARGTGEAAVYRLAIPPAGERLEVVGGERS